MIDSILNSIKKMLGIDVSYTHFDQDLIMHINTVFLTLNQLGIGPSDIFRIEDATDTWSDFFSGDSFQLDAVISYMYLKVKLLFDPPSTSAHMEALNAAIANLEWRMNVEAENSMYTEIEECEYR